MRPLPLSKISELSRQPNHRSANIEFTDIDCSLAFVHEQLTPLYYAPQYQLLSLQQRTRYNQLAAMKVNEQFVLLETMLVDDLLPGLLRQPALHEEPLLACGLMQMQAEEQRHLRMFESLNRQCMPAVYANSPYYFMNDSTAAHFLFRLCGRAPRYLPCGLWFLMLIEEYTVGFSRRMMQSKTTESLGRLEANFLCIHAEHIKDEMRHTHLDWHLLETVTGNVNRPIRALNLAILAKCIRNMFVPKDTRRIIRHLVSEYPELSESQTELESAALGVASSAAYQQSLFSREHTPLTFALFDNHPSFAALSEVMPAYIQN